MHMSLLVILPSETEVRGDNLANLEPQDIAYYEQEVEKILQYGYGDFLDWYVIGGRWCYQLKESFDDLSKRIDINTIDTYTNNVHDNIMFMKDVRKDFYPFATFNESDDYYETLNEDFDKHREEYADNIVVLVDIHN